MRRNVRKRTLKTYAQKRFWSDWANDLRSLIKIFIGRIFGQPKMQSFFMRTTKTLIRLRGCAGWIESSLDAHVRRSTASVAQLDAPSDWRPGGRGFNPRRGRQHSFVEIDHEIFSKVILSLPLIQEGQLSVSGERMCTILVNRLED